MSAVSRSVLITGGSSGIGLEAAVELARRGLHVYIVSRDPARGAAAVEGIRRRSGRDEIGLFVADLSSQEQIRRLAGEVDARLPRLDVLLNNAGAIHGERRLSPDGIEMTLAVNHLSYFLLTGLLIEKLLACAPSRIVNVASDAHRAARLDLDDLQSKRSYSAFGCYSRSKLANIVFTYELARRLEGTGVTANALHPGVVATNFGMSGSPLFRLAVKLGRPFFRSAAKGAETSVYLAASPEVEGVTGKYFVDRRESQSNAQSYDRELWSRLWMRSEQLTGFDWQIGRG